MAFQVCAHQRPGCVIAISHQVETVLNEAFGSADLSTGEPLTPQHRFRVDSHSKSFTAAGIMKLREDGRSKLDDRAGDFIDGLHTAAGAATISELLSHSAGLTRDGGDADQFLSRRLFLDREEVMAELQGKPVIEANTRLKYSNIGYALLRMIIEAVTGEDYGSWIAREIVAACDLEETVPDMPLAADAPFARGHTGHVTLGRRLVIDGEWQLNPPRTLVRSGRVALAYSPTCLLRALTGPTPILLHARAAS